MRNSSNSFLAFLLGLGTGAVLGILFAPDTGSNTRDKLSYRLAKYYDSLKELLGQMEKDNGTSFNGSNPTGEQAQDYRKAEALLQEVESLLDDMKQKGKA